MRLKLYRAASVAEAMRQVRADLGAEALILSTRRTGEGVELTAALELADEPASAPLPATPRPPTLPSPIADLAYHGIPDALAARLASPDLAGCLADVLRFGPLPVVGGSGAEGRILFAGLPGAGKTLSVARLATRMVLAGVRPIVITADGRRAGAAEELAAYTRLLGLELMVAGTPATLTRALAAPACGSGAPILIDSSGINPFVPAELAQLIKLASVAQATPVLVMAAGQHAGEAAEQVQAFGPLGAQHLLPTRLDMVRRLGSIIVAAHEGSLMLTEAGVGSGATEKLVELTPAYLADRLQRPGLPTPAPASTPARNVHRTPVFPTARAQAAESWSLEPHGQR